MASVLVTGPEDTIAPWREAPDIVPAPDASLGRHMPRHLTTSESEPVQRTVRLSGCSYVSPTILPPAVGNACTAPPAPACAVS